MGKTNRKQKSDYKFYKKKEFNKNKRRETNKLFNNKNIQKEEFLDSLVKYLQQDE